MAYQEPVTKKRLLEFINLYRTVQITPVDNDEPTFALTDMPDFEEQLFERAKLRELVLKEWAKRTNITAKEEYKKNIDEIRKSLAPKKG